MIFETVKDYLLDSAFSNRSLKMLKTIEMFKDVCWALSQYADVETSQSQSSTSAPQCHHFNLSTLVLPDLEQMFENRTPSNYTNQLITINVPTYLIQELHRWFPKSENSLQQNLWYLFLCCAIAALMSLSPKPDFSHTTRCRNLLNLVSICQKRWLSRKLLVPFE